MRPAAAVRRTTTADRVRGPRRDLMRFRNAARRDHHALYLGDLDCARIRPRANWRTGEAFIERLRVIIPPTGNQFIAMLKDSSLVSVVGVWELTYVATTEGQREFRHMEMLISASVIS